MNEPCVTPSHPEGGADPYRPQGCTNLKLRQLTRMMAAHYDAVVGLSGLKGTQYSLLSHVAKLGPLRPVDLAVAMKVSPSTLSRNLQPLIEAGWVGTCPGNDGRGHQVFATPDGLDKRQEAQRLWRQAQEAVNARLGDGTVVELHALLDRCMDLMQSGPEAPGLTGPARRG